MTRALVTGGAGFIGSNLVDHLLADGLEVVILDNFASGARENVQPALQTGRARLVEGSILERDAVRQAAAGCDVVFHLAVECVRRSLGDPIGNHHINATGTLNVLEAARELGVKRFVYCSSSEVYGNTSDGLLSEETTVPRPVTVYGGAKLAGEHYALAYQQTYGLEVVVVRPFNSYGPREHDQGDLAEVIPRFLIRVLNGLPPVIFGSGEQGRDFTYVTDTARGIAAAAICDALVGKTVNIGHGRLVTINEVAESILKTTGRNDLSVERVSPRPGDVHRLTADVRRAREQLGFRPDVSFEDGLDRYLRWFRSNRPDPAGMLEDQVINWNMPGEGAARRPQVQ